jgi:hypothetical protein
MSFERPGPTDIAATIDTDPARHAAREALLDGYSAGQVTISEILDALAELGRQAARRDNA